MLWRPSDLAAGFPAAGCPASLGGSRCLETGAPLHVLVLLYPLARTVARRRAPWQKLAKGARVRGGGRKMAVSVRELKANSQHRPLWTTQLVQEKEVASSLVRVVKMGCPILCAFSQVWIQAAPPQRIVMLLDLELLPVELPQLPL